MSKAKDSAKADPKEATGFLAVYSLDNDCDPIEGDSGWLPPEAREHTFAGLTDGLTYYYQMVTHPLGNEACGSAPSTCVNATPTPCIPPRSPSTVSFSARDSARVRVLRLLSASSMVCRRPQPLPRRAPSR